MSRANLPGFRPSPWSSLALVGLLACGEEPPAHRHASGPGAPAGDGAMSDAGGAAPDPDGGEGAPAAGALKVRLFAGDAALGASLDVCADECVELRAQAEGGAAPYTFKWSDGAQGAGPVRVCPKDTELHSVSVMDTPSDGEFATDALEGRAEVQLSVKTCPLKPPPGCVTRAPLSASSGIAGGAFDPVVKWKWTKADSYVTPLVASFTDDNGDGRIDQRDTPDVVVVANTQQAFGSGSLVLLDGATGAEHFRIDQVWQDATPALGDISGDGVIDIVTFEKFGENPTDVRLVAFDHTGARLWKSPPAATGRDYTESSLSLADLDNDGSPEILTNNDVYDATGKLLWSAAPLVEQEINYYSPAAVDLDGDGDLEVVWGPVAYDHAGTLLYNNAAVFAAMRAPWPSPFNSAFVAIADLDGDAKADIVVSTRSTLFVLDDKGKTVRSVSLFAGDSDPFASKPTYAYPPAIHDLDGDGEPEIMLSNSRQFLVYDAELQPRWAEPVRDASGSAGGTAFDFMGDGSAEAMYADEHELFAFAGSDGHVVLQEPRSSPTLLEYPVVADIDGDGSAELLIVSAYSGEAASNGLLVLQDRQKRWVPARRIFNQDTYHVTNINDDGTVPRFERSHLTLNNSFRAQGQINPDGKVCLPR